MILKSIFIIKAILPVCHSMLNGLPEATSSTENGHSLDTLHQMIQTESLIRMQMQKQIASLQGSFQTQIADMKSKHQNEIDSLKAMCASSLNSSLSLYANMFEKKQPSVTFLVGLSKKLTDAPTSTVIKFDRLITNIGNAYDTQSGIFTASVSGTYQFSLTLISETNSARGNIRVNGNVIVHVFADNTQYVTGWGRASESVALHLNAGDQVYVTEPDGGHQTIVGMYASMPVTTFSGHLIQAD